MGCGVSKIDSSKLTPFLHRNEKERINADTSVNLSRKELLKHEYQEEDQSSSRYHSLDQTDNERSMASLDESVKPPVKVEERKEDKAVNFEENKEEKTMLVEETDQEEKRGANEEEEEEERLSNSYLCPSSPSFRVYCVNQSLDNTKDDNKSNEEVDDDQYDQKLKVVECGEIVASVESNEDQLKMEEKGKKGKRFEERGKKGKRFGRVMVKGKPGAVKNLLKVKSCYYPSCASRPHHSTRLLTHNASTA